MNIELGVYIEIGVYIKIGEYIKIGVVSRMYSSQEDVDNSYKIAKREPIK